MWVKGSSKILPQVASMSADSFFTSYSIITVTIDHLKGKKNLSQATLRCGMNTY